MSLISTIEINDKDSIGLDLYDTDGSYSLISQWKGNDGEHRFNMALYKKSKDEYQDKAWPIKVKLGDKATAVATLLAILERLTGETYIPGKLDVPY